MNAGKIVYALTSSDPQSLDNCEGFRSHQPEPCVHIFNDKGQEYMRKRSPREASESADIGASLTRHDLLAERKMLFRIVGVIEAALCMDLQWLLGSSLQKKSIGYLLIKRQTIYHKSTLGIEHV